MDDLEEIRRKKLEEYQERLKQKMIEEQEKQKLLAEREAILSSILTPEAKLRLNNVKLADPKKALYVENVLIALYQSGRLSRKITDDDLKRLLLRMSQKRETKIKIKRK